MIVPIRTQVVASTGLRLDDFVPDPPGPVSAAPLAADAAPAPDLIDGVTARPLVANTDQRGSLCELITTRDGPIEPIVHVYQVAAAPGSIRAWIYHRQHHDRFAFTNGRFEVVLYDLRPESGTLNRLDVFVLGVEQPALLRLPPCIIHGVRNAGAEWASFINMPTKAYDRTVPDRARLPYGDPRIPYVFDAR